jgi:site-specific DNA recombinase
LYARVSTARQEQEQTIASQLAALQAATSSAGVVVAPEHQYVDDGYSGSRLDRPALDALRDAAADGHLDVVFVHSSDRLARNFVHQQVLIEELEKRGVEIHFVERPIGERPEDRLLIQMQGVIAEYERAKIVERTRRGKLHKVKTGRLLPFTAPPYGYAIMRSEKDAQLVVDEVQAQHVRAMYRWACDGLSLSAIARRLNELGIPSQHRPYWAVSSVYKVMTNPVYVGRAYYGKFELVEPRRPKRPGSYRKVLKSSRLRRPQEQWHEVRVTPIIDEKLAVDARTALAEHKAFSPRSVKREYLLRALVTCGHCGLRMTAAYGHSDAREYLYYSCRGHKPLVQTCRTIRCKAPSIRAERLDHLVWTGLVEWLRSPQMLREEVAAWKAARQSKSELARQRARLQKTCKQIDSQDERLVDAYQRGALTVPELRARRDRLAAMRDASMEAERRLQAEEMDQARLNELADDIGSFAETLAAGIAELDFDGRQRIVRLLVERVVVKDDVVTIEHVVPLSGRFSGLRPPDRARA